MYGQVGHEPRPLLPETLGDRLVGSALRIVGAVLFAVAAAGWLSIITWSALDPSLTHATGGHTRNWLGPLGAIVSDLLLQTLGLAAILVFLPVAFTGVELMLNQRIAPLRFRVWLLPLAVLILAGASGSLPAPGRWPLNHGLGGMAGDAVFALVSGVLAVVNPARAGVVTGLALFGSGLWLLAKGLGLTGIHVGLLWQPSVRASGSPPRVSLWTRWRRRGPLIHNQPYGVHGSSENWELRHDPDSAHAHAPQTHTAQAARAYAAPAAYVAPHAPAPVSPASPPPADYTMRDQSFDAATDHGSIEIARRFAASANDQASALSTPQKVATALGQLMPFRGPQAAYKRPSVNILKRPPASRTGPEVTEPVLRGSARLLEDVLSDFSVKGEVREIRPGPVVTLFEFEPARGTKSSRVIALADDIARSMSATSARVAVVPGRNAMGIELPNVRREMVYLREILEQDAWRHSEATLPIILGKSIGGEPVVVDLAKMPHLLVAGTTGSGKSVGVNVLILSLLYRFSPDELRLLLIDPKMLELSVYNGIPHLLSPVVTDPHQAANTLLWAVMEMEERYKRMAQLGVRSVEIYNNRVKNAKKRGDRLGRTVQTGYDEVTGEAIYEREQLAAEPMPYIVVVVDEFADLMVVAGKEIEGSVQRLAQMARAAGIHIVMATQRPSVDVVTGTIKANFPSRIAFRVASKIDSRTILGEQGAEQLLGQGDMLFAAGSGQVTRVHAPFVSDEEVERVVHALRENGEPDFADALIRIQSGEGQDPDGDPSKGGAAAADPGEDLYDRAVAIVHRDQKASTSYLQRRLSIGYNRAADLIERMEREGLVSPADPVGRRRILIGGASPE